MASIVGISIDADSTVPNGGTVDCGDVADLVTILYKKFVFVVNTLVISKSVFPLQTFTV